MDAEITKLALVVAALAGGLALVLYFMMKKHRQRAEQLGPAFELGTARPASFLGAAVDGLYQGYACRYQIQYASQYDQGGASLRVTVSSSHEWTAEVQKTGTELLAKFGLLKDLEIGDRDLDEHFRFAASDEDALRSLFGTESVRNAMHVLTASENFESVRVRAGKVLVRWSPRMKSLDENPEQLRVRLEHTMALCGACGYPPAQLPPI